MAHGTVGVAPRRTRITAALIALVTLAAGVVIALGVAAPAQAKWSNAGDLTHFRVCKQAPATGRGWVFLTRVSKKFRGDDARAGLAVYVGRDRRQAWRSGWLGDRRVERGWVRSHNRDVRIDLWQESGDRQSGSAASYSSLDAAQIRRC